MALKAAATMASTVNDKNSKTHEVNNTNIHTAVVATAAAVTVTSSPPPTQPKNKEYARLSTLRMLTAMSDSVRAELQGLQFGTAMSYSSCLHATVDALTHPNAEHQHVECLHFVAEPLLGDPSLLPKPAVADKKKGTRVVCGNIVIDKDDRIVSNVPHMIVETPPFGSPMPQSYYIYTLHSLIGEGGYGYVFRATRAADGSACAIKIQTQEPILQPKDIAASMAFEQPIREELGDRASEFLRFQYVLDALSPDGRWLCPTVLPVFCTTLRCDGSSVYRMPLMDTDLSKFLHQTQKPLSSKLIRHIMKQLVSAVRDLHVLKVAHLDIKPANVMMNLVMSKPDAPEVLLGDLSTAHKFEDKKGPRPFDASDQVCTSDVRAPEIYGMLGEYDQRADLWSLGCIFYRLVCGHRMWGLDKIQETVVRDENAKTETDTEKTERQVLLSIYCEFHKHGDASVEGVWNRIFYDGVTKSDPRHDRPCPTKDTAPAHNSKRSEFCSLVQDKKAEDLFLRLLTLDYTKRITADEALRHPYFG